MISNPVVQDHFLGAVNMNLLFNSDIVNLLLKTKGGGDRRPNSVIFVAWSALGRWCWYGAESLV